MVSVRYTIVNTLHKGDDDDDDDDDDDNNNNNSFKDLVFLVRLSLSITVLKSFFLSVWIS